MMARMPPYYIPPSASGNNFICAQATPPFPPSNVTTPGVNFPHPNNANFQQTFASNNSSTLQQSWNRFPAPRSYFSGPQYIQHPGWPSIVSQPPPPLESTLQKMEHFTQQGQSPGSVSHWNAGFPQTSQVFGVQQFTVINDGCSDRMKGHASAEDEKRDVLWMESWLQCRSHGRLPSQPSAVPRTKNLKVSEVKKALQDCWMFLSDLKSIERSLTCNSKELSEVDWRTELENVALKKGLFEESFRMFNETKLKEIKRILVKRSKKRSRKRKIRHLEKEITVKKFEKRKKLHLEIDIWLEKQKADVELLKQEESMKQEADAVLWGVRRRQSEGRKILSLLTALVKLHHVRSKKKQPFSSPAEDEEQFSKIIDKLVQLWEGQMKDYEAEEKTLRVMLQEDPEKEKRKDEMRLNVNRLERSSREWEGVLFGDRPLPRDLLQPFLQAPCDMAALIQIRSHWDQYISFSPFLSSSIPVGWVIPQEASSEEWKERSKQD